MCNCNECNVSIVSGNYCHLCAKHMISTNNNVSKEASMKSSKTKLVINDLSQESAKLYFKNSISGTYGEEVYEEETATMFQDEDQDLAFSELEMLGKHESSFLEYQETFTMSLDTAKAILEGKEYSYEGMSDELILEIASQFKDLSEQSIAGSYKKDDRVKVTIQRKSTNGQWYTVKQDNVIADIDFGKTSLSFFFEIEDLFEVDNNGNIVDFKMANDEEVTKLVQGMRKAGFRDIHMQYVGNNKYLPLEQRFLVSCQAFRSVERLCGVDLNQVCEPFYNTYNKETKEVEEAYISFAYDAITDLGNGIVILPSDNAESIEETLNRKYNEGILTGTAVSNNFMALAQMEADEVNDTKLFDAQLIKDAAKERTVTIKKNASLKVKLESNMYQVTAALIAKSENNEHVEFEPANLDELLGVKGLTLAEQNKAKLAYFKDMLSCAATYRNKALKEARLNGRKAPNGFFGFSFKKDYKKLSLIINKYMEAVMIDAIKDSPDNILTDIASLNEGTRKISSFSIEQLNGIYLSATKYRKLLDQFNLEKEVAREISSIIAA